MLRLRPRARGMTPLRRMKRPSSSPRPQTGRPFSEILQGYVVEQVRLEPRPASCCSTCRCVSALFIRAFMLVSALPYVVPLLLGFLEMVPTAASFFSSPCRTVSRSTESMGCRSSIRPFKKSHRLRIVNFALFSCGVMFICRPMRFIHSDVYEAWWFAAELRTVSPRVFAMLSLIASQACKLIYGQDSLQQLGQGHNQQQVGGRSYRGCFLLVELLLPTRNSPLLAFGNICDS